MQLDLLSTDLQQFIAQKLDLSDWLNMKLTCKKLLTEYNKVAFWNWGFHHLNILDPYTLEHPEFRDYAFDPTTLIAALSAKKRALAKVFRFGVEPWQLAAFMGLVGPLKAKYGKEVIALLDENKFGVVEYLVLGGHIKDLLEWIELLQPDFQAKDDPSYQFPRLAVMTGDKMMLKKLVEKYGYEIKHFDANTQSTLLHTAVEFDQPAMALWLIEEGVDINLGANLAVLAAKKGFWSLYDKLLELKINPFDSPQNQRSMVLSAIQFDRIPLAQKTIQTYSVPPRTNNPEESFYYAAILSGNPEIFRIAIRSGWGKITDRFQLNTSPLHIAALHGHILLIKEIAEEHPTLKKNIHDAHGSSLLSYSAKHGSMKKFLELFTLELNGEPFFSKESLADLNFHGMGIAHFAAVNSHLNFLYEFHKKYGGDAFGETIRERTNDDKTLLHLAVEVGAAKLSSWLINQRGFSPTALCKYGDTPFHLLALKAKENPALWTSIEIIADPKYFKVLTDYRNNSGKSVVDIIASAGEPELAAFLTTRAKESEEISGPSLGNHKP
jgi:ankyrin repeat protein